MGLRKMIKLNKSRLPANFKIKSHLDWAEGTLVRQILESDCNSKCYICENKPHKLTVEHVIPVKIAKNLEFVWSNLLLACEHCNNVKGSRFANIIDPTKCDPESHINFHFDEHVKLSAKNDSPNTLETIELLNAVYNAVDVNIHTKISCIKLTKNLSNDLVMFMGYLKHSDDQNYQKLILENIESSSPFAAFKRNIILNNKQLSSRFLECLDKDMFRIKLLLFKKSYDLQEIR
jgi:hypothetical protein